MRCRVCDYRVVRRDPSWVPGSAFLMYKAIPPLPRLQLRRDSESSARLRGRGGGGAAGDDGVIVEVPDVGRRGDDGVFVWEVAATKEPRDS